ncbi:MAG: 23S rRNA pseudouridine1911/1915/1917 synthase [Chlamydiales bacterium]
MAARGILFRVHLPGDAAAAAPGPHPAPRFRPLEEHLVVPQERFGIELDEFLALTFPLLNKGFLRRQVHGGKVLVNGATVLPSLRLKRDSVVSVAFDDEDVPLAPVAPTDALKVLYEDECVLAVDKPARLAVEPERWARDAATLSGALLKLAFDRTGTAAGAGPIDFRPRLLHRIDKDTTGVMLVAKDIETERRLRRAFEEGTILKTYLALVEGEHPAADGEWETIEHPIAPDARKSGRMCVRSGGKPSVTDVSVEARFRGYTLVRCRPRTGRTHQIRVHLAEEGFPLAVDPQYGRCDEILLSEIKRGYRPKVGASERPLIDRLTLHAAAIEFPGAPDGQAATDGHEPETIRVEAPLPQDFQRVLKQLAKVRPLRR